MTTPTIPNGAAYMAATLYTGTGAAAAISNAVNGVSMQPDLVWIKSRNNVTNNNLTDSVRGVTKLLFSNSTAAEATFSGGMSSFDSGGFSLASGGDTGFSASGYTYVGWQWKAGGTAVSNTSGTITSSVSANTTSGFSVITYSGNNSANQTVGHGLGVVPSMVFYKVRNEGTYGWAVYHISIGAGNVLYLNTTDASGATTMFGSTAPTSSVLTVNNDLHVSKSGYNFVAYAWSQIAGYSQFGSYTGNGSTDGPFVYLGFRPKFVLLKVSSGTTANWVIVDTSRDTYNVMASDLNPDSSGAEYTNTVLDCLSNGFKIRNTPTTYNGSGYTYIYACFAENPFKYANAR